MSGKKRQWDWNRSFSYCGAPLSPRIPDLSGYASWPNRSELDARDNLGTFEGQGGDTFASSRLDLCVVNNLALVIDLVCSLNPAGCSTAVSLTSWGASGAAGEPRAAQPGSGRAAKFRRLVSAAAAGPVQTP